MTIEEKVKLITQAHSRAYVMYKEFLNEAEDSKALQALVVEILAAHYEEGMGPKVKEALARTFQGAWITGATWLMIKSMGIDKNN